MQYSYPNVAASHFRRHQAHSAPTVEQFANILAAIAYAALRPTTQQVNSVAFTAGHMLGRQHASWLLDRLGVPAR